MADTPVLIAKAALRRLAAERLEPTPENYARAWAAEGGAGDERADAARTWAALIERVARGIESGSRQWTSARRKDSLKRVLDGSRHDANRLQQRLSQLLASWDHDAADATPDAVADAAGAAPADAAQEPPASRDDAAGRSATTAVAGAALWPPLTAHLQSTLVTALSGGDARAEALADELARVSDAIAHDGVSDARVAEVAALCERARRWLGHRHEIVEQLAALCRELTAGVAELAEDASWAQGQVRAVEARLAGSVSPRAVKAAAELLAHTRARQQQLRAERDRARDALRALVDSLLAQLGEIDARTGSYGHRLGEYESRIRDANSVGQLAGVVQQMLADNREVRAGVQASRERLTAEHARAAELEQRVRALEGELRRLSDEVSTDALTEVANRRGLTRAFDVEVARIARTRADAQVAPPLAIGLLDIDNFKKLNDTLGHAAGDVALKSLAACVRDALRPADAIGRWGGEEFVVLLPDTAVDEAQQVLTRLQRALSASLFLHEGREVFVTFSAGVTAWRDGEPIEAALERADEALYEAKRTGKNRTCTA